jgi:hypothetical protein
MQKNKDFVFCDAIEVFCSTLSGKQKRSYQYFLTTAPLVRYDAFHDASLQNGHSKSFSVHWCLRSQNSFQETWFWLQFADVWAEIIGCLLDPYELTTLTCLWCLSEKLFQLLNEIHWQCGQCMMWLLTIVLAMPCGISHCQWIGWNGPVVWPPQSPNFTPTNLCLWGHLKTIICAQRCNMRDEL